MPRRCLMRPAPMLLLLLLVLGTGVHAGDKYLEEDGARMVDVSKYLNTTKQTSDRFTASQLRISGSTPVTAKSLPWVVAVIVDGVFKGPGAVYNSHWVACFADVVTSAAGDASKVLVFIGVDSVDNAGLAAGTVHVANTIIVHEGHVGPVNALAIIKVCPRFLNGEVSPQPRARALNTWASGASAKFINYLPTLQVGVKPVGELCECEVLPDWNPAINFCLSQSSIVHNTAADVGSVVMINGLFAGFNVASSADTGELYLNIVPFLTWLNDHAIVL